MADSQSRYASAIDISVSAAGIDEPVMLRRSVLAVSSIVDLPLFIDTTDPVSAKPALASYPAKAVLNSVCAKEKDMNSLLPIISEYGAAFVALPVDEDGVPETAQKRMDLAKRILDRADRYGISPENILFDVIVLPSASGASPCVSIETLRLYKKHGLYSIAGLSNISYGMPDRGILNNVFLTLLINEGIDFVIADVLSDSLIDTFLGASYLCGYDDNGRSFISNSHRNNKEALTVHKESNSLGETIQMGDTDRALKIADDLLKQGRLPETLINEVIIPSLTGLGDLFEQKKIFLPSLIASADTVKAVISFIDNTMQQKNEITYGKILLATVYGDIHDIGKNLVGTVLSGYGFRVVDLGKNVRIETILEHLKKDHYDAIALSALMTTTMPAMKETVLAVKSVSPDIHIIVGGACVDKDFAESMGAVYADDAVQAAKTLVNLLA